MERSSRYRRITTAVLGVALLGAGWFLLAPQLFGGSTAYVIVSGSSMQPGIGGGDLVLLRSAQGYHVGDVVGYRSPSLHTVVLHRIVEIDGGRFTFKGDANSWIDPDRPSSSDLLGRMWVRVPGLGSALRKPWVLFTLIGVLLLAAFGGVGAGARKRRVRTLPARSAPRSAGTAAVPVAIVAGLALAASAMLGATAFSTPEDGETTVPVPYEQSGSFAYSATVPPGPVYGGDGVVTGDPVYLRLVHGLDVTFDYAVRSAAPHETTGFGQLSLVITDVNGWSHRSILGPGTTFAGDAATLTGRIDLVAVRTLLERLERTTGVVRDSYEIRVVADVHTAVAAGGESQAVSFTPGLSFTMDALEVQPMPVGAAPRAWASTLHPTGRGQLETRAMRSASLSILGRDVSVRLARIGAVGGACMSVAAILWIALLHRRRGTDGSSWILRRYARLLVPVSGPLDRANRQIHVADIEALAWLAEQHDCPILHARTDRGDEFSVEYGGVSYRYSVASPTPAPIARANGHARLDPHGAGPRRPAAVP